jgi:competence protein ComEA
VRALLDPTGRPAPDDDPAPARPFEPLARLHWQPERRAVWAIAVAVLLVGAGTLWWVLSSRPRDVAVHESGATPVAASLGASPGAPGPVGSAAGSASGPAAGSASGPAGSARASPSTAALLLVDVAGRVRHPGVYRLPSGARVVDALRAAGGALPGVSTASINLAAPLHDGEQVAVGVPGAGQPSPPDGSGTADGSAGAAGSGAVDLNTATLEQLEALPGVGPVLAQNVLDWRAAHGRFSSVNQLTEVSGIGPAKFAVLKPLVIV